MKRILIILIFVTAFLTLSIALKLHYSPTTFSTAQSGTLKISASFYPLAFFAEQIGGQYVNVRTITPASAEPHDYEPTTQDIATIESGNLLILNGNVEPWGVKVHDILQGTNVTVVTAGAGLLTQQLVENGISTTDPHVWLNPHLAMQEAYVIEQAIAAKDPAHVAYYQQQLGKLTTTLDAIDTAYHTGLAHCSQSAFITSHAAFGYLASHYGLQQVAIAGLSPDAEPSGQQLADVSAFAKAHNVTYIFFESLVSPKLAETIAREVGAQTLVLNPIEGLTPNDSTAGKDYTSLMRDNLHNLELALQCTP